MRIKEHPILGRLKEGKKIHIYFDGERLEAFEGEPIAVVLLANNIYIHGKRKDGSPSGLFCARGICTDCVVEIEGEGLEPACTFPAKDGLKIYKKRNGG